MDVTLLSALGILALEFLRSLHGMRTESLEAAYHQLQADMKDLQKDLQQLRDRIHQLEAELTQVKYEREYWRNKFLALYELWQRKPALFKPLNLSE